MSWMTDLADTVAEALAAGEPRTITVDTNAKADLGRIAAERLARRAGGNPDLLTFVVESPDARP